MNAHRQPVSEEVVEHLRTILCDLLVLKAADVHPSSLLMDDLDIDSLGLIELVFTIEREFGVTFPEVKASQEAYLLKLPDALQRLERAPGGVTLFEYVKNEALRWALAAPPGSAGEGEGDLLAFLSLGTIAQAVGARVPASLDANAPLTEFRLAHMFRIVTVEMLARYVEFLAANAAVEGTSCRVLQA